MTIYFIEMEGEGWIKIGFTAGDPKRRMAQLQTGQPQKLRLLGTIAGEKDAERGLHKELKNYRINGEWFRAEPEILKVIQLLIKQQLPWYHVRMQKLYEQKRASMETEWLIASVGQTDQSLYEVPFLDSIIDKGKSEESLRALGEKFVREGKEFPSWVKHRISGLRLSRAKKYIAAWNTRTANQ